MLKQSSGSIRITVEKFFLWFTRVMAIIVIMGYMVGVNQALRVSNMPLLITTTLVSLCLVSPLVYYGFFNKK